eukprot:15474166-Alexandrium_andersonii.AAC.1
MRPAARLASGGAGRPFRPIAPQGKGGCTGSLRGAPSRAVRRRGRRARRAARRVSSVGLEVGDGVGHVVVGGRTVG